MEAGCSDMRATTNCNTSCRFSSCRWNSQYEWLISSKSFHVQISFALRAALYIVLCVLCIATLAQCGSKPFLALKEVKSNLIGCRQQFKKWFLHGPFGVSHIFFISVEMFLGSYGLIFIYLVKQSWFCDMNLMVFWYLSILFHSVTLLMRFNNSMLSFYWY